MSAPLVKVRVQIAGRWEFYGDVEMTAAQFRKYDKALDAGGRKYRDAVRDISAAFVDFARVDFEDGEEIDAFALVESEVSP